MLAFILYALPYITIYGFLAHPTSVHIYLISSNYSTQSPESVRGKTTCNAKAMHSHRLYEQLPAFPKCFDQNSP